MYSTGIDFVGLPEFQDEGPVAVPRGDILPRENSLRSYDWRRYEGATANNAFHVANMAIGIVTCEGYCRRAAFEVTVTRDL